MNAPAAAATIAQYATRESVVDSPKTMKIITPVMKKRKHHSAG